MKRIEPARPGDPTYRQIWRVVDGAVAAALEAHPEYLAPTAKARTVRNSIVKRVVGAIHGYAEQSAWVRSGSSPADASGEAEPFAISSREGMHSPPGASAKCCADVSAGEHCNAPSPPYGGERL